MLRIEQLSRNHDRQGFDCGVPALNDYLRRTARQHIEKGLSITSVLTREEDPQRILGFYTLTFCEIEPASLPLKSGKGLPAHRLPAIRLGRLAVSASEQGKGHGKALLMEAVRDTATASAKAGGIALVVDAKDNAAAAFYRRYGFEPLPDLALQLFMSMDLVRAAVALMASR